MRPGGWHANIPVLDHLAIQCADTGASAAFYDLVLPTVGRGRVLDFVPAFFEAAVVGGAEALHEPRIWPEYHPNYYGAFVRDPDGNNVEAVCHLPE